MTENQEALRTLNAVRHQAEAAGFCFTHAGPLITGTRTRADHVDFLWLSLLNTASGSIGARYSAEDADRATGSNPPRALLSTTGGLKQVVFDVLDWP
ncbi:hypothetical protein [Amycolatopsis pigmentata]|uniref:Uncharacterized protein n=1 Tax=Amycolatopsis pigmentata TaxID=450801 RepID=A0ABW5G474_9PSEU